MKKYILFGYKMRLVFIFTLSLILNFNYNSFGNKGLKVKSAQDLIFYNGTNRVFNINLYNFDTEETRLLTINAGYNNLGQFNAGWYGLTMPIVPEIMSGTEPFYKGCVAVPGSNWAETGDGLTMYMECQIDFSCTNMLILNTTPAQLESFHLKFYNESQKSIQLRMESSGFTNGKYYQIFNLVPGENNLGSFKAANAKILFQNLPDLASGESKLIWNCSTIEPNQLQISDWNISFSGLIQPGNCDYNLKFVEQPKSKVNVHFQNNTNYTFAIKLKSQDDQIQSFQIVPGLNNLGLLNRANYKLISSSDIPELNTALIKMKWEGSSIGESEWTASNGFLESPWRKFTAGNGTPQLSIETNLAELKMVKYPGNKHNFISTTIFTKPLTSIPEALSVDQAILNTEYFDGLGRSVQQVNLKASPQYRDIIQPVVYDHMGRSLVQYLPYASGKEQSGGFRQNSMIEQAAFYENPSSGIATTLYPYSMTIMDGSPLNRVVKQGGVGGIMQPEIGSQDDHSQKSEYRTNNTLASLTDPNYRAVKWYFATAAANGDLTLTDNGWFPDNELYLNISKGENWQTTDGRAGTSETYTDKLGHVVLQRIWQDVNTPLSTYYVYDKIGNLCFVLPPKSEPDQNNAITSDALNKLCFQYRFDKYNRIVEKNQLVMSQDPNQRDKTPQEWTFSKYDALGRMIISGIYQYRNASRDGNLNNPDNTHRLFLQGSINDQVVLWEKRENTSGVSGHVNLSVYNNETEIQATTSITLADGFHIPSGKTVNMSISSALASGNGYSNLSFPSADISAYLTINYFDSYNIPGLPGGFDQRSNFSNKTDGLATAQKVAILNNPTKMLWSVNYYDEEGRLVKNLAQHYKGKSISDTHYDEVSNTYNFAGWLMQSIQKHHAGDTVTVIKNSLEYDHVGRVVATKQDIDNQGEVTLSKLIYNELGQVKRKLLHSTDGTNFLSSIDYVYNERGLLKSSNNDLFKFSLKYEDGNIPQYNGSITGFDWGPNLEKSFSYAYDKLNRLTSGVSQSMTENGITYDKVGNIKTLSRDGQQINYNYSSTGVEGNQLQSVSGNNLLNGTYSYDLNGNAIVDGSKNNIQISYNLLNLPQNITGSHSIHYTYDAGGKMLNKESSSTGFTEYLNGIQYTNGNLDFISTGEGRAVKSGSRFLYQYDLTDHQGNVRLTFDKDPITQVARRIQADDYYPFGKRKSLSPVSLINQYLFNGKEIQPETGEYDYGARFYNPEIARWNVQDPHSESYLNASVYSYVLNDPINLIDPSGMDPLGWILPNSGGKPYWDPNINTLDQFKNSGLAGEFLGNNILWTDGNGETFNGTPTGKWMQANMMLKEVKIMEYIQRDQIRAYEPKFNLAKVWQKYNDNISKWHPMLGFSGKAAEGIVDDIYVLGSMMSSDRSSTRNMYGDNLLGTYGAQGAQNMKFGAMLGVLLLPLSEIKGAVKGGVQYTKSSLALGREVHAGYKVAEHAPALGKFKEFTGIKGIRPDFVDFGTKTIYELKPFNPRGIQLGTKQLNNYKSLFEQNYGGTWKTVLDHY
jgi:RHS repeat-associated protein